MAIHTGRNAVSSKIWAIQFVTGLAAETYSVVNHKPWAGIAGVALQAVGGFVKTWHDHGLRAAEVTAYGAVQSAFFNAAKEAAHLQPPEAPKKG
jgi:hypothetical protein